jgi:hypothetical protein
MEQIRQSHDRTVDTILATSKKHWATYIVPLFALILGLLFLIFKSYLFGIVLATFGIIKILSNKSTSWTLTNEDLVIKSGFMPWRKTSFEIPKEDIYEAFYSKSMFGSIFGFGNLAIRRTEGTTSSFSCSGMTEAKEIMGSINSLVREIKKNPKTNTINFTNNISLADEIQKLVELKNQGILNEDEFNMQKQRLINH